MLIAANIVATIEIPSRVSDLVTILVVEDDDKAAAVRLLVDAMLAGDLDGFTEAANFIRNEWEDGPALLARVGEARKAV